MMAAMWSAEDMALMIFCVVLGVFALGFFITVFAADHRDAKRKAKARRALRRKTKHLL